MICLRPHPLYNFLGRVPPCRESAQTGKIPFWRLQRGLGSAFELTVQNIAYFSSVQPGGGLDGHRDGGEPGGEGEGSADCHLGAHHHRAGLYQNPQSHSGCEFPMLLHGLQLSRSQYRFLSTIYISMVYISTPGFFNVYIFNFLHKRGKLALWYYCTLFNCPTQAFASLCLRASAFPIVSLE
jgi:hypothetical protein